MELSGPTPLPMAPGAAAAQRLSGRALIPFRLRPFDIQLYRACDELTQLLLFASVLFSPWAFGTTQVWSIWAMNLAGYALGVLLAIKLTLRWAKAYHPPRWFGARTPSSASSGPRTPSSARSSQTTLERADEGVGAPAAALLTLALALTTVAILGYILISALNARATARFHDSIVIFDYHTCVPWLPHSLDSSATWMAFWTYLGLACAFWAARDWLLGKSDEEQLSEKQPFTGSDSVLPLNWKTIPPHPNPSPRRRGEAPSHMGMVQGFSARTLAPRIVAPPFPQRFRRLFWLLALNGALLGLECIVQRLADSPKLLFLVQPHIHKTAEGQFGPYAYRSNAAQYFNLLWPVCLGFWWTLNRNAGSRMTHHLVLATAIIMAACPIISTSRAGALVTVGIAAVAACFLLATHFLWPRTREPPSARRVALTAIGMFFVAMPLLGLSIGWTTLAPRLRQLNDGFEARQLMYDAARPMAADYPLFGTGPGSFESVSYLYPRPDIYWPPQLHNDWLETRITFGWIGSGLIGLAFLLVILHWLGRSGIHGGRRFMMLAWLALAGCLVHARYDFPFQIHSVLFLFLLLCAALSTLSRGVRSAE